uniref:Uncharacterized protein n=1 Tax=Caulobacter phage BL57 TaxID=3348355 RepID=A0AB74UNJ9_9VIRU
MTTTWTRDLPDLTRRERDMSLAVINHLKTHPYAVRTPLAAPTPPIVRETLGDAMFFRQPYPRTKDAIWMFEDPQTRDRFLEVYVGEPL